MKQILQKYDRVMCIGDLPGCGKTTACKNSGYVTLFVTPFKKLSQELRKDGYDSVTLNKLLNIDIEDKENKGNKMFDSSKYQAICFDEILLYTPKLLCKIYNYMQDNKHLKFFATGDADQLPSFGFHYNNIKNVDEYLKNSINILFPNQIILKENKRLKTQEDKQKLIQLKSDLFDLLY